MARRGTFRIGMAGTVYGFSSFFQGSVSMVTKELSNGRTRKSHPLREKRVPHRLEEKTKEKIEKLVIAPPDMASLKLRIVGTSPFMQLRFTAKAMAKMQATQEAGGQAKSKKAREPRDFDEDYKQAFHRMPDGSAGIPAAAFRAACISACRMCGFKMTHAKLSIFIQADGYDIVDATPLVRIHGEPEKSIMPVRNENGGADLRCRPVWKEWYVDLIVTFDRGQFSASDVFNLMTRAGLQVGVGEGRADSKKSAGIGFGFFRPELEKGNR